ncbi:serine/arginine repetitive matrix protein 1-like isoform X2 [Ornithorhynchus anatinus]|uniref:serine/arginine repetitive matrix protein 1-like isoform X2 n=1 Tax=Ornithorhynchus anatinus TaxID=9258 RepID=UPI0010A78409|nr:serine/arginine repetitive matrix protein 1-like isoform X2 [Ornithorhynchus anatinus]
MWHDPDTASEESDCTICRRRSERARGRSAEDGTSRSMDSPPLAGKETATRPQTSVGGCRGSESHPPRASIPESKTHPPWASDEGSRSHPPRTSGLEPGSHPPQETGPESGPDLLKGGQLAQLKKVQQLQEPVCLLSGQRSSEDSPERVLRVVYPEPEESWIEPQTSPQIPHPRRTSFLFPSGHGAPGPLGSAERSGQTTTTRPDCQQRGGKVDPAPSSRRGITPKAATRTPARALGPRGESGWAPRLMQGPVLPVKRAPAFPRGPRPPEYRATGCGASPADPTKAAP